MKFIRGTLKGGGDDLAAPGNAYPFVRWSYSAKSCDIDTAGKMNLQLNEVMAPELAPGASLSSLSFEMWSSGSGIQFATPEQAATAAGKFVSAEVKTKSTDSGDVISVNDPAGDKWIRPVGSLILNCNAIRNLSLFWLERLTGEPVVAKEPAILQPLVERILAAVERAALPPEVLTRVQDRWQAALKLEEIRQMVCGATLWPPGLLFLDQKANGRTPIIDDANKLGEITDSAVELAQELHALLTELTNLPAFRSAE